MRPFRQAQGPSISRLQGPELVEGLPAGPRRHRAPRPQHFAQRLGAAMRAQRCGRVRRLRWRIGLAALLGGRAEAPSSVFCRFSFLVIFGRRNRPMPQWPRSVAVVRENPYRVCLSGDRRLAASLRSDETDLMDFPDERDAIATPSIGSDVRGRRSASRRRCSCRPSAGVNKECGFSSPKNIRIPKNLQTLQRIQRIQRNYFSKIVQNSAKSRLDRRHRASHFGSKTRCYLVFRPFRPRFADFLQNPAGFLRAHRLTAQKSNREWTPLAAKTKHSRWPRSLTHDSQRSH